jgi:indolepyruvate ferredoxin oxidoreductase alpha subunit
VPSEVVSFVNCHQRVLVLEEPTPFLEHILREEIAAKARLLGRLTGHLPPEGELCAELVVQTLSGRPASEEWTHIACKPPGEAPLGRYEILYRAVSWIRSEGVFVATDVGSSVRLCYPPYSGADVALCLGSAISVAGGAARTGRTSLGVIGDFAFLHSGMEALLELAAHQLRVLVVVLSNGVQAQTGGQPVSPLDTQALARALGIPIVADWELADLTAESAYAGMHDLLSGSLPAVLLVRDENTPNSALP